jgi:hypothetical protein
MGAVLVATRSGLLFSPDRVVFPTGVQMSHSQRGKPKHRPTIEQYAEMHDIVKGLLGKGVDKCLIKKVLADKWGLKWRSAERAIARAKADFRKDTGQPIEAIRDELWAQYMDVARDPAASRKERLAALDSIVRLLGAAQPQVLHVKNDDTEMAELTLKRQQLIKDPESAELLLRLAERGTNLYAATHSTPPKAKSSSAGPAEPEIGLKEISKSAGDTIRAAFKKNGANGNGNGHN